MDIEIPIIILNWNGINDTIECMDSVAEQTYPHYRVYLVDNGSDEYNRRILKEKYADKARVELIFNKENLGFTKAHNKIFNEHILPSDYKYVVLLNNDAIANNKWLSELINTAIRLKAGMVSSKIFNYSVRDRLDNLGHKFLNTGEILPIATNEVGERYTANFNNWGASACACIYDVNMLREIGCFDEYFITGYEDAELGLRALVHGYKSVFEPKCIVYHKMGTSINKVRDYDYNLKVQKDIIYAYFKLMPLGVILLNLPFILIRSFILLLFFILFLRFKYLRIFFEAWRQILRGEYKLILRARKEFQANKIISSLQILLKQEFFLLDNINRFWNIFIKGEKTIFEK